MVLSENFAYSGTSQNFDRDSYATIAEMKAVRAKKMPSIFHATCEETGKLYIYNKANSDDEILGKWREVSGSGVSDISGIAGGFFINASGDSNNLIFDKTPAEVNAAIEQGSVIIVNANNAKFLLADVNNGIYLFSRSVAKENSLAQIETITATGTGDTWTEIKTNFVAIKADSTNNSEDIYHEDDDLGVDFSDWSEYQEQNNLLFVDQSNQVAYYVDGNGNEISESLVDQDGNENPEVSSRVQGIAFYSYYRATPYVSPDFVENNSDRLELDVIRFKDGFNMFIDDDELQSQLSNYQDTLILGEGLEISNDGTISLKEQDTNE